MEKFHQLNWHEFAIITNEGWFFAVFFGCYYVAEDKAILFCEENDFLLFGYVGINRDAYSERNDGEISKRLGDQKQICEIRKGAWKM